VSACASTRRRGARRAAALPAGRARRSDASGAPWEPGVTGHCCGGHHTGARCVWLSRDKVSHDERTGRNAEPSAAAHAWHLQHDCAAPDRPQVGQTLSAWHSWVTDGADEALLTRRRNQPRGAQSFAQRSSAAGLACAHRSAETAMGWVRRPYRNSRAAGGPESRPGLVREEASARNTPSIFHRSTQQGAPAAMARRPPVAPAAAPRPVRRARASARVGSRAGSCVGAGRAACLALEGHGAVVLARQVEAERQHRALAAQRRQRRRRLLRRRRRRAARRVARARRPRVGHAAPAPARRPAAWVRARRDDPELETGAPNRRMRQRKLLCTRGGGAQGGLRGPPAPPGACAGRDHAHPGAETLAAAHAARSGRAARLPAAPAQALPASGAAAAGPTIAAQSPAKVVHTIKRADPRRSCPGPLDGACWPQAVRDRAGRACTVASLRGRPKHVAATASTHLAVHTQAPSNQIGPTAASYALRVVPRRYLASHR